MSAAAGAGASDKIIEHKACLSLLHTCQLVQEPLQSCSAQRFPAACPLYKARCPSAAALDAGPAQAAPKSMVNHSSCTQNSLKLAEGAP